VQALLDAGADANAKTPEHETSLMVASKNGHLAVVQALLAANANVNAKTLGNGVTALYEALRNGHVEVAQALLTAKADVHNIGPLGAEGSRALYQASKNGRLEVVRALLAAGADISAKTPENETPLIVASRNGHHDVVELLRARESLLHEAERRRTEEAASERRRESERQRAKEARTAALHQTMSREELPGGKTSFTRDVQNGDYHAVEVAAANLKPALLGQAGVSICINILVPTFNKNDYGGEDDVVETHYSDINYLGYQERLTLMRDSRTRGWVTLQIVSDRDKLTANDANHIFDRLAKAEGGWF
jgi:hypothetical protein